MKIGILVECGRDGLEDILVRRICDLLRTESGTVFELDVVPMDNKAQLIRECGPATAGLFGDGCDRVVILWDERPAWPKKGEPLCWHNDRQDILASLRQAGVANHRVQLVCIEREFESWLLFDERMLSCVFSTDEHPIRVQSPRNPDRIPNPKGTMTTLFRQHRGWRYVDVQFARDFARCLTALNRLRKCRTFRRFAQAVSGAP